MTEQLDAEATKATSLLAAKTVDQVWRHRPGELAIAFTDGTRLFVNAENNVEISITGPDSIAADTARAQEPDLSARTVAVAVLTLATAWQVYFVTLLFRVASALQQFLADLGAELSFPTSALLNVYRWSPSVPLVSALLTIDIFCRRRLQREYVLAVLVVVGLSFGLHAWATEGWLRPILKLIEAVR